MRSKNFYEASVTSRTAQKLAAAGLLILGIPILTFSIYAFGKVALLGFPNKIAPFVFLIIGLVGTFASVLAYRLFRGRGVKSGGGVMAPVTYFVLGAFFALLSLLSLYIFSLNLEFKIIVGTLCSTVLSYLCFIASRHRSAMRKLPEWKDKT